VRSGLLASVPRGTASQGVEKRGGVRLLYSGPHRLAWLRIRHFRYSARRAARPSGQRPDAPHPTPDRSPVAIQPERVAEHAEAGESGTAEPPSSRASPAVYSSSAMPMRGVLVIARLPSGQPARPRLCGTGRGRREGLSEIRLYTNEAMTENLAYYPRNGYTETQRAQQDGFSRVYFRKCLDS
jgi:hypothetical protein